MGDLLGGIGAVVAPGQDRAGVRVLEPVIHAPWAVTASFALGGTPLGGGGEPRFPLPPGVPACSARTGRWFFEVPGTSGGGWHVVARGRVRPRHGSCRYGEGGTGEPACLVLWSRL